MIPNPWLILGALVAAIGLAIGGYTFGVKTTAAKYEVAIKAQKLEAAMVLAQAIKKNADREEADRQRAITNQVDYDNSLKALVDSNRKYAGQLRDPGRRQGSACPGSQASPGANTVEVVPVDNGISDEAGKFLREQADLADQVTLWGKSCFEFVNKK